MHRRDVVVDGIARTARVDRPLVDDVLVPVLRDVAAGAGGRRRFVFLAAPPATGKSTLAAVLAREAGLPLDVIGIDGFHHPHHYLQSHTTERDGARVPLASVKGAPETYDVAALDRHLRDGATRVLTWPTYDRTLHDVVPAGRRIGADLVLVEGNWLLLGEPGWRDLAEHAAFSIFIDAAPDLLAQRLVERKIRGGTDPAAAREFVARSDLPNVERVLARTDRSRVDLTLHLNPDGTIDRGESR